MARPGRGSELAGASDAMFAPVCTRFTTDGIPADEVGQRSIDTIQAMPAFLEWKSATLLEKTPA